MVKICSDSEYKYDDKYSTQFRRFPFPLSPFQKHAIEAIVEGNHVLVTAHTGSGKTLPAEFAIQHFFEKGKKVIYTSPIKALSNQKYYEFSKKYEDAGITFGLMTGDIKTNPDADVLIMTTEILMNYLFRSSSATASTLDFNIDIHNQLGCVVFDEVHYINDKERGGVWEKTILMLPPHIQMVMLSATIDNPAGFAEWVEKGRTTSDKLVYLASTNYRIVPLTHYGFLTTTESIFKGMKDKVLEKQIRDTTNKLLVVQSDKGVFNETNVGTISKMLKLFDNKQVFMKRSHVLNSLARHLKDNEMLPAIAFVFSRKHVELCAGEITIPLLEDDSKVPYIIRRECEQVIRKLPNFKEYLELPEYNKLVSLLEKGIGIHHSGMIPILREIVELMISKKYIKMLFATESFAIGLDCPIKTAIFTSLSKFDGNDQRILMAHEYTQMAGRAGRRGIDTIGNIIHCNNLFPMPSLTEYKTVLSGRPQKLISKYHISYSLVLNMITAANKDGENSQEVVDIKALNQFSEKSMIHNEIQNSMKEQNQIIDDLKTAIDKKRGFVDIMRTPYLKCLEYIQSEFDAKNTTNKKRKDADKKLRDLVEEFRSIVVDVNIVRELIEMKTHYDNEVCSLEYMKQFIHNQTLDVCNILLSEGFISSHSSDDNTGTTCYDFLPLGKIASRIAEVHPLVLSKFMMDTNFFESFSTIQLVGLLSCFTDIKIASDERAFVPASSDVFLNSKVRELAEIYKRYDSMELERDLRTGFKYDDVLMYDIMDFSMQWCDYTSELECKQFIHGVISMKSISIGDFNKALLKIVTIAKELISVCEEFGQIELMHKLSSVDNMILKYVTTAQSLYV
jgi:superfamily II RNA helicase